MPFLHRLEKALERLAEGGAERVFGGRLDLIAIGQELFNAAAQQARSTPAGPEAPDTYWVAVAPEDYTKLAGLILALQDRYAEALWRRLRESGYALGSVPRVCVESERTLGPGRFAVKAGHSGCRPACRLLVDGPGPGEYHLTLPAVIGRSAGVDLCVDDPSVSRRHARIVWERNHYVVEDLNSKNGTLVGDSRIGKAPIEPGDLLTVGLRTLQFAADSAPCPGVDGPTDTDGDPAGVGGGKVPSGGDGTC